MSTRSILVVDDEEIIRQSLQHDLEDQEYQVAVAPSGEVAVTMLENNYDLIITDLIMEGIDGLQVLKQAKEHNANQAVFILTGYGELNSAVTALRLGADDYLLKPYNHDEMMFRISRCLEKMEMQQKIQLYEQLLSICSECKKIKTDSKEEAEWVDMEQYLCTTTGSTLSHGICPTCYKRKMDELKNLMDSIR